MIMRLDHLIVVPLLLRLTGLSADAPRTKEPTVVVAILARNKAHTLPYFLSFFERINYPKARMHLWLRSDNNVDNTIEVLKTWLESAGKYYHGVNASLDQRSNGFADEQGRTDWSVQRFLHVIKLREQALDYARESWADFIWMLDADAFLTHPDTLRELVSKDRTVVAPLLKSDGMYSNFWSGMTEDYYYLRTNQYEPILFGEEIGCFQVPMIHTALLIDLRKKAADGLTYDAKKLEAYDGPTDDIITFALGAAKSDVPLFVCNDKNYGFAMVPLENDENSDEDFQRLTNIKAEILAHDNYLPLSAKLEKFVRYPLANAVGLDHIYMINLLRRPERRGRMHRLFKELGIRADTIDAVDGRTLNESALQNLKVELMAEYADPYRERPMTAGEIGCFLSHHTIWTKMIEQDYKRIMILEDDVRFEPFFRQKMDYILWELKNLEIDWDLVYLGRKRLAEKSEERVAGSKYLVRAGYSYWTLGYLLSASGAKKLIAADPLKKLVPVDEYLPILSDTHPREDWKLRYPRRDLMVLSSNPLLIHPTHYTGEHGYISDTENSVIVEDNQKTKAAQRRQEL